MKSACVAVFAYAAACVPTAPDHTCSIDTDCINAGVMGRCEATRHCSFPDDTCGSMGHRYHARAGAQAGVCVVSLGGKSETVAVDLRDASDTTQTTCAPPGARDAYIELVSVPMSQLLSIDTPISNAVLALREGACPGSDGSEVGCATSSCTLAYNRLIETVGPGRYCLVVEDADSSTQPISIRITAAGRNATVLAPPSGSLAPGAETNTCDQPPQGTCLRGPSAAFVLPSCPDIVGHLSLTIDPVDDPPSLDAAVTVRRLLPTGPELHPCTNDAAGQAPEVVSSIPIGGPDLVWILVSGASTGTCGPYALDYALEPI